MATKAEITDQITNQRGNDILLLDDKIAEAIQLKNGLAIANPKRLDLSATVNQLMNSRTDLHIQELKANLGSAQLAAALAKITTASKDLKTEAAKMKNVTSYINNTNAVVGAATKVTNVLKNGG